VPGKASGRPSSFIIAAYTAITGTMLIAVPGAKPHSVCGRSSVQFQRLPFWNPTSQSIWSK
jgi:hypothetical protein